MDVLSLGWREAINLANNWDTAPDVLVTLLSHEHGLVRNEVLANASTPKEVLIEIAKTADLSTKAVIVNNKSLSAEEALAIASTVENDSIVWKWIGYRRDFTPEMLIRLAFHPNNMVVMGVVSDPHMPFEAGLLATLGRDEDDLTEIFQQQKLSLYPSFASYLTGRGVDFSVYDTPGSLPFQFFMDWLSEFDNTSDRSMCVKLLLAKRFYDVRAHVEAETGLTGLPDGWVVRMFRTLVGEF